MRQGRRHIFGAVNRGVSAHWRATFREQRARRARSLADWPESYCENFRPAPWSAGLGYETLSALFSAADLLRFAPSPASAPTAPGLGLPSYDAGSGDVRLMATTARMNPAHLVVVPVSTMSPELMRSLSSSGSGGGERTGTGQRVEVTLLRQPNRAQFAGPRTRANWGSVQATLAGRLGSSPPNIASLRKFAASDGEIFFRDSHDGHSAASARKVAREDCSTIRASRPNADRLSSMSQLFVSDSERTCRRQVQRSLPDLMRAGVPAGPVTCGAGVRAAHVAAPDKLIGKAKPTLRPVFRQARANRGLLERRPPRFK